MTRNKVIIITGPTASGKTALAVSIARKLGTKIISADSRQCFIELNTGVAKPSPAQLAEVVHYFINSHSIHDEMNAATFESFALKAADEVWKTNPTVVIVGGTGLYIKAFCEGLDHIPAAAPEIREQLTQQYQLNGLEWLQRQVLIQDPDYFNQGEIFNPRRLMRALEVKLSTGLSILEFQKKKKTERDFEIVKYAIDLPRPQLVSNINSRVDEMIKGGLLEEVMALIGFRYLNALQTVGYTELFDYLDNTISLEDAISRIKINTRHYGKRQMTWFRRDPGINWIKKESDIKI